MAGTLRRIAAAFDDSGRHVRGRFRVGLRWPALAWVGPRSVFCRCAVSPKDPVALLISVEMPRPRQRSSAESRRPPRRRWRDYRTTSGRSPVEEFIDSLSDGDAAAVLAGMAEVRDRGLVAARHLQGDIWEVRIDGDRVIYRVLFAEEGARGRVLLALEGFNKKSQKTPPATIQLAQRRLSDWRRRGAVQRASQGKPPPSR
jgi:phage-related protein